MAKRQERERRFIAEYVALQFPPGQYVLNVPLGSVPEELVQLHGLQRATAIFRPQRRRVDAVAWDDDTYWVIEAKIRDPFEGIGRLVTYALEARRTRDLPGYEGQPIVPRLVVPFSISRDRDVCRECDIELVEYTPAWIADYVRERQLYFTAEYRQGREKLRRDRELFGLE